MEITNELAEESFSFSYSKRPLTERHEEQAKLDEKAIPLYNKYHTNLQQAENILQAEMKRTCAPDPKHKKQLEFEFSYEEKVDGRIIRKEKFVECQPHFKLIHDASDLRVYFYWKDEQVGAGKKVLIGRVGRHPWKK